MGLKERIESRPTDSTGIALTTAQEALVGSLIMGGVVAHYSIDVGNAYDIVLELTNNRGYRFEIRENAPDDYECRFVKNGNPSWISGDSYPQAIVLAALDQVP